MQCQRSRPLLNVAERRLLQQLRAAVEDHNADVQVKVRLADALDLKNSGISDELFSYGIRAHLDFVVVDRDTFQSLFAVEYDGAEHFTDRETIGRDHKKTEICRHLKFDLLRITKCHLEVVFLGKTQLRRLVEDWFAEHGSGQTKTPVSLFPTVAYRR